MFTWLADEPKGKKAITTFLSLLLLKFALSIGSALLLVTVFRVQLKPTLDDEQVNSGTLIYQLMIVAVLIEELIFRLPLAIAQTIASPYKERVFVVMAIALSIVFGYLHGGVENIAIQGVSGLILCLTFAKYGGLYGGREGTMRGLRASYLLHLLFNFTLLASLHLLRSI